MYSYLHVGVGFAAKDMISITKDKRDGVFRWRVGMLRDFLYSEGKQEASMDSVKQIIFLAHDRNRIVMLRITRVHKIHEEARLVDIVPRLDGPMPMFQVSRTELEEQDTFFAIWCQCQRQGISHIASHLADIPSFQLRYGFGTYPAPLMSKSLHLKEFIEFSITHPRCPDNGRSLRPIGDCIYDEFNQGLSGNSEGK